MKKLFLILCLFTYISNSQTSLYTTASFAGNYVEFKQEFKVPKIPLYIGLNYGAEYIHKNNVFHKIGIVPSLSLDDIVFIELDLNLVQWHDLIYSKGGVLNPYYDRIKWTPLIHIGMKVLFDNNLFTSIKVSYPGFCQIGLGYKLTYYERNR